MEAVRIHKYGNSNVLTFENVPMPSITSEDVLIRVVATSVNPVDWKIREGYLQDMIPHEMPLTLGWDVSGVIEAIGEDVPAKGMRADLNQTQPRLLEPLVQPVHINAVGETHVAHAWILACAAHLDYCSIVLVENTHGFTLKDSIPKGLARNANRADGHAGGRDLNLWSVAPDRGLFSRNRLEGVERIGSTHTEQGTGGATTGAYNLQKLSLGAEMKSYTLSEPRPPPAKTYASGGCGANSTAGDAACDRKCNPNTVMRQARRPRA